MKSAESWLRSEAHWARQRAIELQRDIDDLHDPRLLQRQRWEAYRSARQTYWNLRAKLTAARERVADLSDAGLPDTIARLEKDRDMWQKLADEHEARILDEGQPALDVDA